MRCVWNNLRDDQFHRKLGCQRRWLERDKPPPQEMEKISLKFCYGHLHGPVLLQLLFDVFLQTGYWWCHKNNAHLLNNVLESKDKYLGQQFGTKILRSLIDYLCSKMQSRRSLNASISVNNCSSFSFRQGYIILARTVNIYYIVIHPLLIHPGGKLNLPVERFSLQWIFTIRSNALIPMASKKLWVLTRFLRGSVPLWLQNTILILKVHWENKPATAPLTGISWRKADVEPLF